MNTIPNESRRRFLKAGALVGGGFVIGFVVPGASALAEAAGAPMPTLAPNLASDQAATAWTSRISGRKCLKRFWTPWRRVAVEEGQPEQAPFISR